MKQNWGQHHLLGLVRKYTLSLQKWTLIYFASHLHPWRDSSPKNENSVIIYSHSSSSKPVWMSLFCWTTKEDIWRKFVTRLFWGTIEFHSRKKNTMEVNGAPELLCFPHSSEYLPLCSAEQRHSYRFGTTWGWVNDRIFGWTIPLSSSVLLKYPRMLEANWAKQLHTVSTNFCIWFWLMQT